MLTSPKLQIDIIRGLRFFLLAVLAPMFLIGCGADWSERTIEEKKAAQKKVDLCLQDGGNVFSPGHWERISEGSSSPKVLEFLSAAGFLSPKSLELWFIKYESDPKDLENMVCDKNRLIENCVYVLNAKYDGNRCIWEAPKSKRQIDITDQAIKLTRQNQLENRQLDKSVYSQLAPGRCDKLAEKIPACYLQLPQVVPAGICNNSNSFWMVDKCFDSEGKDVTEEVSSTYLAKTQDFENNKIYLRCVAAGGVYAEGQCSVTGLHRTYIVDHFLNQDPEEKYKNQKEELEEFRQFAHECRIRGYLVLGIRCFNNDKDDVTSTIDRVLNPVPPEAATAGRQSKSNKASSDSGDSSDSDQPSTPAPAKTCYNQPVGSAWYIENC